MMRRIILSSFAIIFVALCATGLVACSDAEEPKGEQSESTIQRVESNPPEAAAATAKDAANFFSDLPRAATVSDEDMGDLYFKILTRLATKLRAVSNEESARSARAIIDYARSEVSVLVDRTEALAEVDRSQLFQNSVAQMTFAKRQYKKAVERLAGKNEAYLQNLAEYADKPWPSLR